MSRWLTMAFVLFLLGASRVHADIPSFGPRPSRWQRIPVHPSNAVPVVIQTCPDGGPARLLIPRSLLGRAKKVASGERFGALEMPIPLAVVLMLSAGGLGLVCFRGRRFTRAPLVFLFLLAVAGAGASMLWANAPPPMPNIDSHKIALPITNGKEWKLDKVRVEITEDGDTIRLMVPKSLRSEKEPAPKEKHDK